MSKNKTTVTITAWPLFSVFTAIIGNHIHSSIFWTIFDFLFAPLVWIKWLICHDVTLTIIKEAFSWFLK